MNERTKVALLGSIAKWEGIVAGTMTDRGCSNCPLCAVFLRPDCYGCPVAEKVGESGCANTPYVKYSRCHRRSDDKGMQEAAQAELEFLRSLLPEESAT